METKKQFKWYTIFEYEKEQDYLRNMHRSGWKFVKVKGLGVYSFEKCVPQDVVYPEFLYLTKKSIICKTSDMGDCDRRFLLLTQTNFEMFNQHLFEQQSSQKKM